MADGKVLSGKSGRVKIGASASITGATGTTTIVITSTLAPAVGSFVLISGVVGMTALNNNGKAHLVTAIGTGTFSIVLPTVTSQTWTSGGTAQKVMPITDFKVTAKADTGDCTDSNSGDWKENVVGFKEWSATYSGYYHKGQGDLPLGDELPVILEVSDDEGYSGTAIFESFEFGAKVPGADPSTVSGSMKGQGELVKL